MPGMPNARENDGFHRALVGLISLKCRAVTLAIIWFEYAFGIYLRCGIACLVQARCVTTALQELKVCLSAPGARQPVGNSKWHVLVGHLASRNLIIKLLDRIDYAELRAVRYGVYFRLVNLVICDIQESRGEIFSLSLPFSCK